MPAGCASMSELPDELESCVPYRIAHGHAARPKGIAAFDPKRGRDQCHEDRRAR